MKKLGNIAAMVLGLLIAISYAQPASACDKCVSAGSNGWVKCESGYKSGYAYCYGGFGTRCTLGEACSDPGAGGPRFEPEYPDAFSSKLCLSCDDDKPAQGFALRTEVAVAEVSARQ